MFEIKSHKSNDKWLHMQRWIRVFIAAIVVFGLSACDDTDEPMPEPPASTFKLHIDSGNVNHLDVEVPEGYPPLYNLVLKMEDLPADEKILYIGGVYSTENQQPDLSDCTMIFDYTDDDLIQTWDWEENPLYWGFLYLIRPLPETTYYIRGYVLTDKGEYYSNTLEFRSSFSRPVIPNPETYDIPVIFHLFPDADGEYPVKEWMVREQLDYANLAFSNYFNIPGQIDTGVRFVAADHAPDGAPLESPGIVYEKESFELEIEEDDTGVDKSKIDDKYIWDMEHVLNIWVTPIIYGDGIVGENQFVGGCANFPVFDADEVLEGCSAMSPENSFSGIFLNTMSLLMPNNQHVLAHEAGHFFGLYHVFEPNGDFCGDTKWYDYEAYWGSESLSQGEFIFTRIDKSGQEFWSDNIMDNDYGFMTGFTPDQVKRIQYTIKHAYFIPGKGGKRLPMTRSHGKGLRFCSKPVI